MIFDLFKSKPTISEIIPKGSVDIHSHILPGIDDGPKNAKSSIILIDEMKKLGYKKIIGTPHSYKNIHDNTSESIKASFNLIEKKVNNVSLKYASEYYLDFDFINRIGDNLLCIKDKMILVETNLINHSPNFFEIIFDLIMSGYKPIIAHPERYLYFKDNHYKKLKNMGCLFQINLLSLTEYYGNEVMKRSNLLIKNNLIDFTGSDIHNINFITAMKKLKIKLSKNNIKLIEEKIKKTNEIFL